MKRPFDLLISILGLLVFSIPILVLILLIYFDLGWPVLFTQVRTGIHGKPFKMFKLRTMTFECSPEGHHLPDDLRITPLGRFLRATSLDELPELWNVFKGEMSMVGPRPLLTEYLPLYSSEQSRRHDVRPGITGWAQINGRNSISWEDKVSLDIWYIDHHNFWLDLGILLVTIWKVIRREGIGAAGKATTSPFTGAEFSR